MRRLALLEKPAAVSCKTEVMRKSSSAVKRPSSALASWSPATPESMAMPLSGAALRINRSRLRLKSSSSMADKSLPAA